MKILVADDEILVRMGLKAVFKEYGDKYEIIEAIDGKDALEKYNENKPPLVFVDITMPKMNGMDLIKEIKKINKNTKIVILTCHNDYKYLRDSIRIGVDDYILKTSINNKELINIAENTKIKTNDVIISQRNNTDETKYKVLIIEKEILNAIKNMDYKESLFDEFFEQNNINKELFNVFVVTVKNISGIEEKQYIELASGIKDVATDLMKEYGFGYIIEIERNIFLILYSSAGSSNLQKHKSSYVEEYCERLINTTKSYYNKWITIGIYEGTKKSNISEAVKEAKNALKNTFYDRFGGYHYYNNKYKYENITINIDLMRQKLISKLKNLEYDQFLQVLDNISFEITEKPTNSINVLINMFLEIYYQIKQHIQIFYPDRQNEIIDSNKDYISIILCEDIFSIVELFKQIIKKMNMNIENIKRDSYYINIIQKAKEYISEHIVEEIDLTTVAQNIFLSPNYFSKIFKERAGIGFVEYCIQERMKMAKACLKSGDKIFVAANKVGYKNYSYFHKLFKKRTGITPGEYKKHNN